MFSRVLALLSAALLMTLSACGDAARDDSTQAAGIAAADVWVKSTDMDMSAAFAVISNSAETDAKVVAVTTDITDTAELHETADGSMRKVDSFTIPAGDSLLLEPGGNHLMLLNLTEAIEPGQEVAFTLEFEDGSTFDLTATAKDFAGGAEDYDDHADHEGHDDSEAHEGH